MLNAALYCQRVILEFDISDLPEEAVIVSAKLKLYYFKFEPLYGGATAEGRTYWAYKQTHTDWVESESSWNEYKSGSNWTAAGGDWVTSNPSGGSAVVPGSYGWMEWDIKAIVEDAIANHSSIVELLVKDASDLEAGSPWENAYFHSRNYGADPSLRPKIEIAHGWAKEISEGVAVGEVVIKNPMKLVAEGVALSEVLVKNPIKILTEGLALGEVVETVRIKVREFIEGLAVGEVLVKQAHKVISEGVAIGEVLSKQISRVYSEGVAVGEVVIKLASKVFTEGLAIGEVLGKYISKMFSEGLAIGEVLLKMRVLQSIRELSPFRVLDSLRNKLKERQL